MNNEIEFRAWSRELKRMINVWCLGFDESGISYIKTDFGGNVPLGTIDLIRFTGLTDKNGIRIFEGDIVASGRFTEGVIRYGDCGGGGPDEGFRTMGFYIDGRGFEQGLLDINPIEIIGNIYENPNLLEQTA